MHRNIKCFHIEGKIKDDSQFIKLRNQFESLIIYDMREKGYIPALDLGSLWYTSWKETSYEFDLIMYGFFVGKVQSWNYEGWTGGKLIPRSTANRK